MSFQYLIVSLIIFAALIFAGNHLRVKLSSFKPKKGVCNVNCGCENNSKNN